MKQITFPAVLAIAGTALMGQVVRSANPVGTSPAVTEEGRGIYNRTCTGCHGPDGGEGDRAPSLNAQRRYFRVSETAIFDTIKNGIAGTAMPASSLPDNDIWKVVVFIRNVRSTASDLLVPGNVEKGMETFNGEGSCSRCHMIRGRGGLLGPDLSSVGAQLTLNRLTEVLTQETPIANGYRPMTVTTADGDTISGVARNVDTFSIQLMDEQGKLHMLDTAKLAKITYGTKSLMPHNIDKVLSAEQYRDLVAMLARQTRTKVHARVQGEGEIGR